MQVTLDTIFKIFLLEKLLHLYFDLNTTENKDA